MLELHRKVLLDPRYLLAFGFGTGLSPKLPGTLGTALGAIIYFLLGNIDWVFHGILLILTFGVGIFVCNKVTKDLGVHDYQGIVWDEMVGMWMTMLFAPEGWKWIVIGFLLFRFFDGVKPWPISWLDKQVPGSFGIMVDDLLAGVLGCATIQAFYWLMTVAFAESEFFSVISQFLID